MVGNSQDIKAGREIVFRLSIAVVCISALTILQYNLILGTHKLPQQIVRFGLTIWLCYAIYRGSQPARWIGIALFAIGGVVFALLLLKMKNLDILDGMTVGLNAATYLVFAGSLFGSGKVIAFLNHQRSQPLEDAR